MLSPRFHVSFVPGAVTLSQLHRPPPHRQVNTGQPHEDTAAVPSLMESSWITSWSRVEPEVSVCVFLSAGMRRSALLPTELAYVSSGGLLSVLVHPAAAASLSARTPPFMCAPVLLWELNPSKLKLSIILFWQTFPRLRSDHLKVGRKRVFI